MKCNFLQRHSSTVASGINFAKLMANGKGTIINRQTDRLASLIKGKCLLCIPIRSNKEKRPENIVKISKQSAVQPALRRFVFCEREKGKIIPRV